MLFQITGRIDSQPNWQPKGAADVCGVPGAREECGVTAVSSFVRMRCVFHAWFAENVSAMSRTYSAQDQCVFISTGQDLFDGVLLYWLSKRSVKILCIKLWLFCALKRSYYYVLLIVCAPVIVCKAFRWNKENVHRFLCLANFYMSSKYTCSNVCTIRHSQLKLACSVFIWYGYIFTWP